MRLLLVEDDSMIGEAVLDLLRAEQYAVDWARDGDAADTALRTQAYDLVLLDLGLPQRDGLTVLRDLRARKNRTPCWWPPRAMPWRSASRGWMPGPTTTCSSPMTWTSCWPASVPCCAAQRAVPSRCMNTRASASTPATREVTVRGTPVVLSGREWAVLEPLIARPGMVLSRQQLEDKLYGWGDEVSSNAVEVYIHGLRKKLGPELVLNVRGVGYLVPKA